MSVQAISWAFAVPDLDQAEKFVLVALANHSDEFGVCWPHQSTLAVACACSERTVRTALASLCARKLVVRLERRRTDGSRRSDVILLAGLPTRRMIVRHEDHPILTPADVAVAMAAMDALPAQDAGTSPEQDATNRQNLPVDDAQNTPDQPAESDTPTGKICTTNRQNLPVTIMQEPSEEPSEEPRKEEGAQARETISDEFMAKLLRAVGYDPAGALPSWWQGAAPRMRVLAWLDLGLTPAQVIDCARLSRKDHPDPPEGPKALERPMARYAKALKDRSANAPADPAAARLDVLNRAAGWVRQGSSLARTITMAQADDLMREALVTPADLHAAGVRFNQGPGSVAARFGKDAQ